MNAEEFVAHLHHKLLVDDLAMYERFVRAERESDVDGLDPDDLVGPSFVGSLTADQEAGYLRMVRGTMMETISAVLATLDGDDGVGFRLVPDGGGDIAGELHDLFVDRELALAGFTSAGEPDAAGSADDVDPASLTAEDFIDRVREVLDDDVRALYAGGTEAGDPAGPGRGVASDFLATLTEEQREEHRSLVGYAISGTAATILGVLDGATATRTDYIRFAVVPPGGADISGDLQELLLMAEEDGPFGEGSRS